MIARTEGQKAALRAAGAIAAEALAAAAALVRPGVATADLDAAAAAVLAARGARSAPALVYGFPASICVSINAEAAHGIPGPRVLEPGDLVNIDVCAEKNGYYADCALAVAAGSLPEELPAPDKAAGHVMSAILPLVRDGTPWRTIGAAIGREAGARGFVTIRDLFGHGTGRAPHEAPDCLEAWDNPDNSLILKTGMVLAVEFFLALPPKGARPGTLISTAIGPDGWTLSAPSGTLVAQAELTLIVGSDSPEILTPTHR